MDYDISSSWRGVVGCIKPNYRPGYFEDFIRLLPVGIGVIPLHLVTPGTPPSTSIKESARRLDLAKERVAELALLKVDLISIEGGPLFMLHGYKGAGEIVRSLEEKHGIPIITTGMTHVEALRALGIKRLVGATYLRDERETCANYIREAGFEVICFESIGDAMNIPHAEVGRINSRDVYTFIKKLYLKNENQGIQGIYLLGSGWPVLDIIPILEGDLQVPVVHPVTARVWAIQKRLHVREPRSGYGRLLEDMP